MKKILLMILILLFVNLPLVCAGDIIKEIKAIEMRVRPDKNDAYIVTFVDDKKEAFVGIVNDQTKVLGRVSLLSMDINKKDALLDTIQSTVRAGNLVQISYEKQNKRNVYQKIIFIYDYHKSVSFPWVYGADLEIIVKYVETRRNADNTYTLNISTTQKNHTCIIDKETKVFGKIKIAPFALDTKDDLLNIVLMKWRYGNFAKIWKSRNNTCKKIIIWD